LSLVVLACSASLSAQAQTNGQPVSIETSGGTIDGVLVDRVATGYLLRTPNGKTRVVPYEKVLSISTQPAGTAPAAQPAPVAATPPASPEPAPPRRAVVAGPAAEPTAAVAPVAPVAAAVAAEPGSVAPAAPLSTRKRHRNSLTLSPFHFFLPALQVMDETRIANKFGVAGIIGLGSLNGNMLFQYGLQLRGYPVGSFDHGMSVGIEALNSDWSKSADELSLGTFLGYKFSAGVGFTVDVQLGVELHATARVRFAPLMNVGLGWSFGTEGE
jgi:hypothetical protein